MDGNLKHSHAEADRIDCELFRLMSRVSDMADTDLPRSRRKEWSDLFNALRQARPKARALMSAAERSVTT